MFRVFEGRTADEVWQDIANAFRERDSIEMQSSRAGLTYEILHSATSISNPLQRWITSRYPPINPAFAIAELVWIMSGRNDSAFLNYFNRELPKYAGEKLTYHGAYGHRLRSHLGMDQLERTYKAFKANPDSRQVVLQIWDPSSDFPDEEGRPRDTDIPCNIVSLLKIRNAKLEWMQIIRSNDLFRGLPYNFLQFTFLQEIMAGWLHLDVGSYHQVSDSLHIYEDNYDAILKFEPVQSAPNTDTLSLDRDESEMAFKELAHRTELFIAETLSKNEHLKVSSWLKAPESFQNMLFVLAAEAARRRKWTDEAIKIMTQCSNPALVQVWKRWFDRVANQVVRPS